MSSGYVVTAVIALVAVSVGAYGRRPVIIWNASPSVPIGLYQVVQQPLSRGQLAVVRLPSSVAAFADARGYLPATAYLVKPIVGVGGDRVCRIANVVTVNIGVIAVASISDSASRPLPRWHGCRLLRDDEIFILGVRPGSFDGRYFGALAVDSIVGRAQAIWTTKDR